MMKKPLLITLLFGCSFGAYSQGLAWAKQISGPNEEIPESMKIDSRGNIYLAGTFSGTIDLDPGPGVANQTSNGIEDIFIVKFDSTGNYIWGHHIGGVDYDKCHSLVIDKYDNLYLSGEFNYTVDFDPGLGVFNLTETGYEDIYICKLTNDGNFIWAKQISGTDAVGYSFSMDMDHSGNLVLTGGFWATVDFDPGPSFYNLVSHPVNLDIYVSKYDTLGNFIWARAMNGTNNESGSFIKTDSANNIYISGYFDGTTDFDPGVGTLSVTPVGNSDFFISKISSSGNLIWSQTFGSTADDFPGALYLDDSANLYYNGRFNSTIDFDPGPGTYFLTSVGNEDIVLLKIDSALNFIWAKQIGGPNEDASGSLMVGPNGEIYYSGTFSGTVDLNPGPGVFEVSYMPGFSSGNGFLLKLDSEGEFIWANQMEDSTDAFVYCFAMDDYSRLLMAGTFDSTLDIMPGPMSENLYATTEWGDIFLTAWNTNTCAYIMNPATTTAGNEITAVLDNASYQWLDCGTNLILPGDTNQTYTALSNGVYAVIISDHMCQDTSDCVMVMTTSIDQVDSNTYAIFPNPTTGMVNISTTLSRPNFNTRVLNFSGQIVLEAKNISYNGFPIDLSKEPQGIYFVEVFCDSSFERFKVIKN